MSSFLDTTVIVRHLTGDPQDLAQRASTFLSREPDLFVTDLVVAETVYVLESYYRAPRTQVAQAVRSLLAFRAVTCVDPALLLRSLEVYEIHQLDFAEAYLVACAESTGVSRIASFDRAIDRATTVTRVEP